MQKAEKNLVLRVNFIPSAGLKASAREAKARERGYTFFITYVTTPQMLKSLS